MPAAGPLVLLVAADTLAGGRSLAPDALLFHTLGEVEPLPDTMSSSEQRGARRGLPVAETSPPSSTGAGAVRHPDYPAERTPPGGEITNMYAIAETLLGAGRVVHL